MRAFVAINLPAAVRAAIAETLEPVRRRSAGVRWTEPGSMHLTLQFLGNVEQGRMEGIGEALARAAAESTPFDMELRGFGAFPTLRRPRVLWVGVADVPPLLAMQRAVEESLERVGFTPEARPFHPHITVGRAERGARAADTAATAARAHELEFEASVGVETIELMESVLHPHGARYSVVRRFELGGS